MNNLKKRIYLKASLAELVKYAPNEPTSLFSSFYCGIIFHRTPTWKYPWQQTKTHAFWQQHVVQWQKSNLSQAQYCKKHELKAHNLSYHKRRIENKRQVVANPGFIKLPVPKVVDVQTPLTLHFANGLSLSGIEPNNIGLVRQLAAALS